MLSTVSGTLVGNPNTHTWQLLILLGKKKHVNDVIRDLIEDEAE